MSTTAPSLNLEDKEMIVPVIMQPESAGTIENQSVNTYRFTWKVEKLSKLTIKKLYSEVFIVGGYQWRLLMFPKGNNVDHLSLYLDAADASSLPEGWTRFAQFTLALVNQTERQYSIKKESNHHFQSSERDWGWTSFMPLSELYDANRGFLVNDICTIEVDLAVGEVSECLKYKWKATGYVGPKDRGAKSGDRPDHISEPKTSPVLASTPKATGHSNSAETVTTSPEKRMGGDKVGPMLTEFDGVDLASEKANILAALKESNPTCLESLHLKTPLVRRSLYDLLAQLFLDLKSLGKESDPSAYAALLPVLHDLETCGFQLAELKAYIELLRQTAEERVAVIAKREAAEKVRQELLVKLQSLDEEIAAMGSLPTAPTSFPF